MIKVAIIQNFIVPYEVPLFEKLSKQNGVDLTVFYCAKGNKYREWKVIKELQHKHKIINGFHINIMGVSISFNPSIFNKLKKQHPDVIILSGGYLHLTMLIAYMYGKIYNVPVIYRSDENENTRKNISIFVKIVRQIEKFYIKNSKAIIVPSLKSKIYHADNGAKLNSIFISPYTTNNDEDYLLFRLNNIEKEKIKFERGLIEKKIILYVGQLIKRKGIIYLLDAFKYLKDKYDVGLLLVGSGPLKQFLQNYCVLNNIKGVYFPGFMEGNQKILYYAISDVFVLPTLKDHWGIVVNEAMLSGLSIVLTKVAGSSEIIKQGKNGFIVNEGSSHELYNAIEKIILDDELAKSMGIESVNIIKKLFSIEKRTNGFLQAINFSIKSNGGYNAEKK